MSKQLQDPKIQTDVSVKMFKEYGFSKAKNLAKGLSVSVGIDPVFQN